MNAWRHNWAVVKQALRDDREQRGRALRSSDTDFLPAALEVIERPVSPTARLLAWALILLVAITLLWAIFGKVDVVASASGTLMPTGSIKLIQSPGSGVVRAIHVRNGDVVRKGQPLIDLDPTLSTADLAQAEKALAVAELDVARNRAIADALAGMGIHFTAPPGTPSDVAETQRTLIEAQLAEVGASSAGLAAARASALADADAARAQVAKLSETGSMLDREIADMRSLDERGYASGMRLIELQRQRRQETGDREVASAQVARGLSEARKASQQIAQTREQARHTALADLAKAEGEAILRREEVTKARQKRRFQRLVAPTDGTIQQLEVHTIGGVVEPVRALMTLVPAHDGLEVEARILNKDIGFVRVGQDAAVKLEAFPFTRYGTVSGHVRSISRDAVPDKRLGSVYVANIVLDQTTIDADGRTQLLSPGLTATVDIKTGKRSIISYLLSPIEKSVRQAAREH
ncbi:MAG: HlyD family type I secretion periplasmic adaptor subunit [Sphingobium sp.]